MLDDFDFVGGSGLFGIDRETNELPPFHHTVVRIAEQQMGVGGDDSWGAKVHPEYLLDVNSPKKFRFCFRGI